MITRQWVFGLLLEQYDELHIYSKSMIVKAMKLMVQMVKLKFKKIDI